MRDWWRVLGPNSARARRLLSSTHLYLGEGQARHIWRGGVRCVVPNLFLIGAGKAGSTSFHDWLERHPDVFMSRPLKEPHLFYSDDALLAFHARRGRSVVSRNQLLGKFMLRGYRGQRIIGESSTGYTALRRGETATVPASIRRCAPDARLLYVVRNPLDRMLSHYRQDRKKQRVDRPFEEWMQERTARYLDQSLYYFQLSQYLREFPSEQIHVVVLEELATRSHEVLAGVLRFVGLSDVDVPFPASNQSPSTAFDVPRDFVARLYRSTIDDIREDRACLEEHLGRRIDAWDLSSPDAR